MKKLLPFIIMGVFAVAALVVIILWGKEAAEYAEYGRTYDEIAVEAVASLPPEDAVHTIRQELPEPISTSAFIPEPDMESRSEQSAPAVRQDSSANTSVDFARLLSRNPDTAGWLVIPGTKVNYPIVQTGDNETYLDRDFDGRKAACGTLFLDYRNAPGDRNLIIYGHNMGGSGSLMFSSLMKYKKESYLEEHPFFRYSTPEGSGEYRIIAVCHLDIRTLESFNFLTQDFAADESFAAYAESLRSMSLHLISGSIDDSSRLITLVTCDRSQYGEYGRLIVVGIWESTL